jgi:hypothetical protein
MVLSRLPDDAELAAMVRLYELNRNVYRADPESARQMLTVGLASNPTELDPADLAAWTQTARALFNLHESITRP